MRAAVDALGAAGPLEGLVGLVLPALADLVHPVLAAQLLVLGGAAALGVRGVGALEVEVARALDAIEGALRVDQVRVGVVILGVGVHGQRVGQLSLAGDLPGEVLGELDALLLA